MPEVYNPFAEMYCLEYRQYTARNTTFDKTLMNVRVPGGKWRPAKKGATYAVASDYLAANGWKVSSRAESHHGGMKIVKELWEKRGDSLPPL